MVTTIDASWTELSNKLLTNPNDFLSWEALIQLSSQGLTKLSTHEDLQRFRITYESLLSRYPNLEQYWVNYASWEYKLGNTDECLAIYEKAISIMPSSLKIWCEYLNLIGSKAGFAYNVVLKKYQQAEVRIGDHYHSFGFWLQYLKFEKLHNGKSLYYYNLFKKILDLPLYHYAEFFSKWFKEIDDLNKDTILLVIRKEELPKRFKITEAQLSKGITDTLLTDLKVKLRKIYTDVYITTQFKSHELFRYENKIKLEYFTPNIYKSYQELTNWGQYLEFISKHPSNTIPHPRIVNLFERALISLAAYPQFWIQYAEYFLSINKTLDAKNLLYRSLTYLNESNNLPVYTLILDIELSLNEFQKAYELLKWLLEYRDEVSLELYLRFVELQYLFLRGNDGKKVDDFKIYLLELFESETISLNFQINVIVHVFEYFRDERVYNLDFLLKLNIEGKFDKFVDFQMIKLKMGLITMKINELTAMYHSIYTMFEKDEEAKDKLEHWYELYLAYEENEDPFKLFEVDCGRVFADV